MDADSKKCLVNPVVNNFCSASASRFNTSVIGLGGGGTGAEAETGADAGAPALGVGLEANAAFASPPSVFEAQPKKKGSAPMQIVKILNIFNRNENRLIGAALSHE